MSLSLARLLEPLLARGEPAVLVTVAEARGSTPREAGTRMLVTGERLYGTVGGGRLEWEALQHARAMIASGAESELVDLPLGAALGQCCGGRALLRLERAGPATLAALAAAEAEEALRQPQVLVCGAGHVGTALVRALVPLPVSLVWIDGRAESVLEPPSGAPPPARDDPAEAVAALRASAAVAIMTHSHDLDYDIATAALRRDDLAYVGLIGSATKRRRFERLFTARGGDPRALERLVCPIGDVGIVDKRPEVIAAFTAAELLAALGRAGALGGAAPAAVRRAAG
ncbi:MAG: xanthine dehydrogenase accessory protein XdhC [Rhodospirillaceae bacterium]|nr:xanthine dehydrogenase accessory protein XdhC [Rhodospirillaceae bacterium]